MIPNVLICGGQMFSRDLKLLIAIRGLRTVTDLFLGTFFVSFIMHNSVSEIVSVSTYKLFEYVAICLGFLLMANFFKKINKVYFMALGVLPKIALLLFIMFAGRGVIDSLILTGIFFGFSTAAYCLPSNTLTSEYATPDILGRYFGISTSVSYLVKIIAPVVLGFFIDFGSFVQVAPVLLLFSVAELLCVLKLSPSKPETNPRLDIRGFIGCIRRCPDITKLFSIEMFLTFGIEASKTVVSMYIIYLFHTDLNLGILTTVFSLCSVGVSYIFGRYGRFHHYPYIMLSCMIIILLVMSLFVFHTTPLTFVLYNFMCSTALVLIELITGTYVVKMSYNRHLCDRFKVEYFTSREVVLFIGRWVAFVGLMYVGVFGGYPWLRWYLVLLTVSLMTACIMAMRFANRVSIKK